MKPLLLLLLLIVLERVETVGYCYNTKCRNFNGTYIKCDGQSNTCIPGTSTSSLAKCSSGQNSEEFAFWCGSNEECKQVEYTGKAYCGTRYRSFLQLYYRYVLVGLTLVIALGLVLGTCYCFWFKWACFNEQWVEKIGSQSRYVTLLETN